MNYKIPQSVLVVIHSPELEVLLLERVKHPGFWQSVTGSKDSLNEPWEVTAAREVAEETGIDVSEYELIDWEQSQTYVILEAWRHRYAPGVMENLERVFSVCVPRDIAVTLAPNEHRAWRWLPYQEAAQQCFSPSNAQAILQLPERYLD